MEIKIIQSEISKLLNSAINEQRISNAYIFYGTSGSGKEALAIEFAKDISSTDSEKFISSDNIFFIMPAKKDFYEKLFKSKSFDSEEYKNWKKFLINKIHNPLQKKILSDSKNIPVEAIKNLKEKIYFKSKKRKVVLIFNSEALSHGSAESANMLLKILEEPPKNTTFILVTDLIDQVQSTQMKVGVYPVADGNWFDVGQWKDYNSTVEVFQRIEDAQLELDANIDNGKL